MFSSPPWVGLGAQGRQKNEYGVLNFVSIHYVPGMQQANKMLTTHQVFTKKTTHLLLSVVDNQQNAAAAVELAVFASTLAFICYTIGLKELGVSRASVYSNFIPVFTAIFSYFVIGEMIGNQKIIGMVVVLAGLFLSQIKQKSSS